MGSQINFSRICKLVKIHLSALRLFLSGLTVLMLIPSIVLLLNFEIPSSIYSLVVGGISSFILLGTMSVSSIVDKSSLSLNYMLPASLQEKYISRIITILVGCVCSLIMPAIVSIFLPAIIFKTIIILLVLLATFMLMESFSYGMKVFSVVSIILIFGVLIFGSSFELPKYVFPIEIILFVVLHLVLQYRRLKKLEIS